MNKCYLACHTDCLFTFWFGNYSKIMPILMEMSQWTFQGFTCHTRNHASIYPHVIPLRLPSQLCKPNFKTIFDFGSATIIFIHFNRNAIAAFKCCWIVLCGLNYEVFLYSLKHTSVWRRTRLRLFPGLEVFFDVIRPSEN